MREAGHAVWQVPLPPECDQGNFVPPTIIEINGMEDLNREVFGPVMHVLRFDRTELDETADAINATGYALTGGVHSRINETVTRVTNRLKAGNLYVNRNTIGAVGRRTALRRQRPIRDRAEGRRVASIFAVCSRRRQKRPGSPVSAERERTRAVLALLAERELPPGRDCLLHGDDPAVAGRPGDGACGAGRRTQCLWLRAQRKGPLSGANRSWLAGRDQRRIDDRQPGPAAEHGQAAGYTWAGGLDRPPPPNRSARRTT